MVVVGKNKLNDFTRRHPDARSWISWWLAEVEAVNWEAPRDVKNHFGSASLLKENIVIFNVGGNKYRMAVQVSYNRGVVAVKAVGTHKEYDKWEY